MNRTRVRAIFAWLRLRAEDRLVQENDRSIEEEIFSAARVFALQQVFLDTLFTRDEKKRFFSPGLEISRYLSSIIEKVA